MLRLSLALLLFPALLSAQESSSLPKPTGTRSIGKTSLSADGEPILLWYPAQRSGHSAPYASKPLLASIEKSGYNDQTAETIQSWAVVKTHSYEGARPISGRTSLLIFLPGAGVYGFQYTAFAEELSSYGYIVAVVDYFSPQAPSRTYREGDFAAMEGDMARVAVATLRALSSSAQWRDRIHLDRVGIAGHSIGGAASIAAARLDHRFLASCDMDGAPFGESLHGAIVPLLVLRSKPIYSDADLAKRGRTREQLEKMGEDVRKIWTELESRSEGTTLTIFSIKGTGHFSFSDAPFVMPNTITRFGGEIVAPQRSHTVITTCLLEFFDDHLQKISGLAGPERCSRFEEITRNMPAEPARP